MKCQILFSGKNKKNIISLLSAELAQREVKIKECQSVCRIGYATQALAFYKKIFLYSKWRKYGRLEHLRREQ